MTEKGRERGSPFFEAILEEVRFGDGRQWDGSDVRFVVVCCGAHEGVELAGESIENMSCLSD